MTINPIVEKVKKSLTEDEQKEFLNLMRNQPEKVLQLLTPAPKSEKEKMIHTILNDIDELIRIYGSYDFYDKGIYQDERKVSWHIIDLQKLKVIEVREILLELLDSGLNQMLVGYYIGSFDGKLNEKDWDTLIDHDNLRNLY